MTPRNPISRLGIIYLGTFGQLGTTATFCVIFTSSTTAAKNKTTKTDNASPKPGPRATSPLLPDKNIDL